MFTRSLSQWLMPIALAVFALVALNLLVATSSAQGKHTAALIHCSGPIQACIDAASDGDTILIAAGRYTESLTLSKPVSLTGVSSDTTIIHAVAAQRVLTVTGAAISTSVVISGLTFTGGDATNGQGTVIFPPPTIAGPKATPSATPTPGLRYTSNSTPIPQKLIYANAAGRSIPISWQTRHSLQDFDPTRDGVGGGILITGSARPEIQSVRVISNIGGYGGGLYAYSNNPLTLTHVDVISNVAVFGGGLLAHSPIMIREVHLSENHAVGGVGGGAQISGAAVVWNSHIAHNVGGGMYIEGDLTMEHTDVSFNTDAVFLGGNGIAIFSGNLILRDATIDGNQGESMGGGIFADDSMVWITGTRVLRNSANYGGGLKLHNGSSGQVVNSLFVQNSSSYHGASISSWGDLQIIHTTIADTGLNPGPAIFFEIGSLFITNTLITSHTIGIERSPLATGVHEDYNLFFGNSANTSGVITGAHSIVGDPRFVDPAHDNYHLAFDSDAIEHGIDAGVYTDLDGNLRPFGAGFDIGAYEYIGGSASGTRYVATMGNDVANDCLNEVIPCATVQHAIDVANDGDQVLIASGLYTQSATLYKPVSLTGASRDSTILHAAAGQRVLTVTGATISNSVVISGLTFTGGEAEDPGGGMLLADSAQPLIHNSVFISNTARASGGGLYASDAVTLVGVALINNHTFNNLGGGGLFAEGSIAISDSEFIGNGSYGGGGLIQWSSVDPVYIYRSRFERNDAYYGGGLAAFGSDVTLIDTEFISNTSRAGSGAFIGASNLALVGGRFEGNNCLHGSAGCDPAGYGGGLVVSSTVTITGTSFINNSAAYQGGGIDFYGGGGRLINTLLARNSAPVGAAIAFESPGNTAILYSTFVNPTATTESAIAVLSGTLHLTNTIIASHTVAISNMNGTVYEDYNLFFGNLTNTIGVITDGGHSLMGDPKFVDPLNGDYHLRFGSAAIDHGIDEGVYTDLDGNPRPSGMGFDIGAHEYQGIRNLWLPLIRK